MSKDKIIIISTLFFFFSCYSNNGLESVEVSNDKLKSQPLSEEIIISDSISSDIAPFIFKDIPYVTDGHPLQKLDLYIPKTDGDNLLPFIIFIHGGGWQNGGKEKKISQNAFILESGFAMASINYRLTSDSQFPAQIHDCKAAVRYLRRNARTFGLDPEWIGVWGISAGGHLASLLGLTNEVAELESDLGYNKFSSDVKAVCNWFGPSDLIKMGEHLRKRMPADSDPYTWPEVKFLGGLVEENIEKAKMASPITFVSRDDPPFLIMHGEVDPMVPVLQSKTLHKKLQNVGVESQLIVVPSAKHGFFKERALQQRVVDFFKRNLLEVEDPKFRKTDPSSEGYPFVGNWALTLPGGTTGWMTLRDDNGTLKGNIWMVGAPKPISDITVQNNQLYFTHHRAVGDREYDGGPATGNKIPLRHVASLEGDLLNIGVDKPQSDGSMKQVDFIGKRIAPLPIKPDVSKLQFGEPIELFNGKNLDGWRLTNPKQINKWRAEEGALFNDTPKKSFDPFAHYGNLRTDQEYTDFNLQIDFNVPKGGNSGIYLRGMYEVQVVDHDSKMQGIHGVGAVFNRILPKGNYGKQGGEWQHYDITLVDRHITVILNGIKIIDNEAIAGCTNGALTADESLPGPIYLQGDHTSVRYRNMILRPVLKN